MNWISALPGTAINAGSVTLARRPRVDPPEFRGSLVNRLARCVSAIFVAALLVAVPKAWSQQQATLSGVVRDPSAAVIPGATIRVTNINTQVSVTAETNSTGYYVVGDLIPGTYTITVQKEGFKTANRTEFTLTVAQAATVDFQLELGRASQAVTVNAAPPLLEREDATVGQVIGPTAMVELPLNGRNYFDLAKLSPGISSYGLRSSYSHAFNDYGASFNSGSGGEDRNEFTLDGSDIKAYQHGITFVPTIDAIQEFSIQTTPYAADLGTSPGAQILLVTKSGTDQFHGEAYEFFRNSSLNSYNYFDNRSLPIPELRKNQFGANIGGPIVKGKLFFFASYEGQRERIGETFFGTVPTVLMRQGIFTEIGQPIYDPFTTAACAACSSGVSRQAFSNNTIPTGLISSASSTFLQSQFPLPTSSGIANNFAANSVDRNTRNQVNGRVDYSRPKDTLFGRYSFHSSQLYAAKQTFGGGSLPGFGDNDTIAFTSLTVAESHAFNPTTILLGQASYFRNWDNRLPQQLGNNLNEKLGIPGVLPDEPFNTNIAGLSNPGSDPYIPEFRAINQFSYVGKLTKVFGKHTLKLGGEYDRWQTLMNAAPTFPEGQFSFDGSFTKDPNAPSSVITGSPFADFLLGYPVNATSNTGDTGGYMLRNNWRWWVNDEMRVSPNLTLNLGVRWEYDGPFYEKFNRLTNFDPATGDLVIAGRDFASRSADVRPYRRNYAPRVGFAYSLPGRKSTVLRGGYGIFYDVAQENAIEETRLNPPFSNFPQFFATAPITTVPTFPIAQVFAPGVSSPATPGLEAIDFHMRNGYQQQASFGVQQQIGANVMAEVSYNWQKNTGFPITRSLDAPRVNGTFVRPYPEYSGIDYFTNLEYGNYNALLAKLTKQFSKGLTFISAFTWSKYLDNVTGGDAGGAPGDPGFQNPYCFSCDYGPSASDFEKRFVQSVVYYLPSLSGSSPAVKNVLGGWQVAGIFTYQSGFPVTPLVSFDNSESLTYADRPDRIPGVPIFTAGTRDPSHWFNPAAFVVAPPLQFGNAGKGIILGPNLIDLDLAVMKVFRLSERFNLQFRAEGFNLPNHPNFGSPNPYIDIPSVVGSITSTSTTARQLQFALKLMF
jgi:hypothetical protein